MIREKSVVVDMAIRRFKEEKGGKGALRLFKEPYREIVGNFVAEGNRVNDHDVKSVGPSRYAPPLNLIEQIQGETVMSWTGWVFEMNDGALFSYGSTFLFHFFQLPSGYSFSDIAKVHNHSYLDAGGVITAIRENREAWLEWMKSDNITELLYRDRPFFNCFLDEPGSKMK